MRRLLICSLFVALAFGPALPARAADGDTPDEQNVEAQNPKAKPNKKKTKLPGETTFSILSNWGTELTTAPGSTGKDGLAALVNQTVKTAGDLPPGERDKAAASSLERMSFVAASIDPKSEPPDTVRMINNGAAYLNTTAGRPEKGYEFAQKAVEFDPEDRDAYINRSLANYGLNRLDEAYKDADRATKLDPASPDAWRARSMASYGKKDYLQAIEDSRRALAIDPNDKTAFAIMKLSESRVPAMDMNTLKSHMAMDILRDYHGMVQQMTQVQQKSQEPAATPQTVTADRLVREAAAKITMKDYPAAIAEADKAIHEDPNNSAAYYYRAAAENLLGRFEEAETDASRALVLAPSDFALRDARAWALNHMGRFRDAIADANHSLEVNPKNPYAFANRGYSYEQMGDLDTMLRDLKSAAALSPQFEPAYKDAAARHGLNPEAAGHGPTEAQLAAAREHARRRSFLTVLISSTVGGLLIAAGFLHLTQTDKPGAVVKKGKTVTAPGLSISGLESGYTLGPQIGIGGMGVVYEAVDKTLQRKVAVKVLRSELASRPADRARFLEEARTVAALHHPCIVDIHSIAQDPSGVYLIFEYVDGRNLYDVISQRGRISLDECRMILKQVCQALDYAHHHGIVHRDLKPGNIMVASTGLVKVMDFGISRHALDAAGPLSASEKATACGTPDYMAPEQGEGLVRKEADVYSLGCLLYEMLTGRRPFAGAVDDKKKLARDYPKASTLVPGLSPEIDRLIEWALHPDPTQRIRSVRDFWALLDHAKDANSLHVSAS